MCFECSKEPSHRDSSFEYPQHMFWMRNKDNSFPIHTLIWRPDCFIACFVFFYFQAFKTLRSFIEKLEKVSENPDLQEELGMLFFLLQDIPSGSDIMPCIKMDQPLVIYILSSVM